MVDTRSCQYSLSFFFYRFRTVCSNTLESCETIDNLGFIITRLVEVNFVKIAHVLVYSRNESGSVCSGREVF